MDPFSILIGFVLGVATVLIREFVTDRVTRERDTDATVRDRRLARTDATEVYITGVVSSLFARAIGKTSDLSGVADTPFGTFELELLSEDLATEWVGLCRWLWEQDRRTVSLVAITDRDTAFRIRLRRELDVQRDLAIRGKEALIPSLDATERVNALVAEEQRRRNEEVERARRPPRIY